MRQNIERALAARHPSRRVVFRNAVDESEWLTLVRDIVALANSGGGVVLFGVTRTGDASGDDLSSLPDIARIVRGVAEWTGGDFDDFEFVDATKQGKIVRALVVGDSPTPLASPEGIVYVRRGPRTVPASTAEIAASIERHVRTAQREWLTAVRRAIRAPAQPEISGPVPIRVVHDTSAPAYRVVDYDKTHPYRQKELLAAFRHQVPDRPVNQFDLLAVRHTHHTDDRPDFSHQSLFGTRQYSQKFLDWLVDAARRDPQFFERARAEYSRQRARHV